jgi:hypothetical protein
MLDNPITLQSVTGPLSIASSQSYARSPAQEHRSIWFRTWAWPIGRQHACALIPRSQRTYTKSEFFNSNILKSEQFSNLNHFQIYTTFEFEFLKIWSLFEFEPFLCEPFSNLNPFWIWTNFRVWPNFQVWPNFKCEQFFIEPLSNLNIFEFNLFSNLNNLNSNVFKFE